MMLLVDTIQEHPMKVVRAVAYCLGRHVVPFFRDIAHWTCWWTRWIVRGFHT